MILALARPDPKKNLTTLIKAYGENQELRDLANLVSADAAIASSHPHRCPHHAFSHTTDKHLPTDRIIQSGRSVPLLKRSWR